MIITDFCSSHIDAARNIAQSNYEAQCRYINDLPGDVVLPDLSQFAHNNLGVAAWEEEKLIGYMGAYCPSEDAFGTTNVKGIFSPVHAHGVLLHDNLSFEHNTYKRDWVYSMLYQEVSRKWVNSGIRSHAIALYTFDQEVIRSFFYNGFGLRCIDATRSLKEGLEEKEITFINRNAMEYCEIPSNEWGKLLDMHNALIEHLGSYPSYMKISSISEEELYQRSGKDVRYFGVKIDKKYVAYLKISNSGESFISDHPSMINICGAYCEPNYRGLGLNHNLLCYLIEILKIEGNQYLGVDYESFNPNARGFWPKYFKEYTNGVVRRIDEKAVDVMMKQTG